MNDVVANDMSISSRLFHDEVWPLAQTKLGDGQLMMMENRPDYELATNLDILSGIDAWQIHREKGMRGIASRVQYSYRGGPGRDWRSFTVRMSRVSGAKTEFEKRCEAIGSRSGWLYPHITIQAYALSEFGPILSVGIVRTVDLINYIKYGFHSMQNVENADFAVCWWDKMRDVRIPVFTINPDNKK